MTTCKGDKKILGMYKHPIRPIQIPPQNPSDYFVRHCQQINMTRHQLTSSNEAFPALSPIPLIVTSNCRAPARAP